MDLNEYDYKRVRVVVQDDPDRSSAAEEDPELKRYLDFIHTVGDGKMELVGIAYEYPREYGDIELGRDEESISVCGYQIYESDIYDIEILTNEIDEYIAAQDPKIRKALDSVRATIADTLPDAEEKINWKMPTWKKNHDLIHFAAQKHHLGIYPGPEAIERFADMFSRRGLRYSKGAVQLPYDRIELDLVEMIAEYCGKDEI